MTDGTAIYYTHDQFLYFGRYICREWSVLRMGGERLIDFQIAYTLETTLPD